MSVTPFPLGLARLDSPRRRYSGRCECGAVRYRVELDLSAPDARTDSVWEHSVEPAHFLLCEGHESLIGYQFAAENVHHFFCVRCNARAFSHRAPDDETGYYTIDLKALDLAPAAPLGAVADGTPSSRCAARSLLARLTSARAR